MVASLGAVAFTAAPADSGVVVAQEDDNGNESDGPGDHWLSPSPGDENESSTNESDGEEDGEDDSGGGGVWNSIRGTASSANPMPDAGDYLKDAWEWIIEQLHEMMVRMIDDVVNELLGTPTIENDGALGIFGSPVEPAEAESIDENDEDGRFAAQNYTNLYHSVYLEYVMPLIGAVLTLMALSVLIGPALSVLTQRRMFSLLGSAALAVFLVVASWEFAALMHAFSDAVTQEFLPDSGEVMSEDRATFAGPLAAVLGLSIVSGGTSIALLGMHAVRHMLLYLAPIVLPALILLAYWGGHRRVKQTGSFFIWQWYGLLVWNWPTALLLRAAYELDWTFHSSEIINFAMTIAIFLVAVGLPIAISGAFGLIGLSMRGVAASAAGSAFGSMTNRSTYARSPDPSGTSRTRRAGRRLWSGATRAGISAKNRASGAYARGRSRLSRGLNDQSGPSPSRDQVGVTPSSRRATTDGGVRGRSMNTGVTPAQRRRANHKAAASKPKKRLKRTNDGSYTVVNR